MEDTWWRSSTEVDDAQRHLINDLPVDGRYLILGPPGSGKTNILLLRAKYLRLQGHGNILLLSFTRALKEFIVSGVGGKMPLPPNRVKTHKAWALELLRSLGAPFQASRDDLSHDEQREELNSALIEATRASGLGRRYYDAILIDEVQDHRREELGLLASLTQRFMVAGDNRQRVYDVNEGIEEARNLGCAEHSLEKHYRMGREICRVADRLLPDESGYSLLNSCNYVETTLPSSAVPHSLPSLELQLQHMITKISTQIRVYPNQMIGVITHLKKNRDRAAEFLSKTPLANRIKVHREEEDSRSFDVNCPINIMTIRSAKGTEFRAVHFIAADEFAGHYTRELAFTAITRARTSLDVYHTRPLEASLEAALAQSVPPPSFEDLF